MPHSYRVQVRRWTADVPPLPFDCQNRRHLYHPGAQQGGFHVGLQEHQAFIVGLKLFGEVMMQHRKEELFKGFLPISKQFMGQLKRTARGEEAVVAPTE